MTAENLPYYVGTRPFDEFKSLMGERHVVVSPNTFNIKDSEVGPEELMVMDWETVDNFELFGLFPYQVQLYNQHNDRADLNTAYTMRVALNDLSKLNVVPKKDFTVHEFPAGEETFDFLQLMHCLPDSILDSIIMCEKAGVETLQIVIQTYIEGVSIVVNVNPQNILEASPTVGLPNIEAIMILFNDRTFEPKTADVQITTT